MWLSLIRDAKYVITDSFHAVVFSIVYRKRFVILKRSGDGERSSMNSRLYSLCKMFPEIEGRIVGVDVVPVVEEEMRWGGVEWYLHWRGRWAGVSLGYWVPAVWNKKLNNLRI